MDSLSSLTQKLVKSSIRQNRVKPPQWKPNVTVAAIIERDGRFMMIEEFSHGRMVYNQPSGHLEEGESLFQAVAREVREETAWGFKAEAAIGLYMHLSPASDVTYLRLCFVGQCFDHQPELALDDGIHKVEWMTIEEIRRNVDRLRSPMILKCLQDYLDGHRFPLDYFEHQIDR